MLFTRCLTCSCFRPCSRSSHWPNSQRHSHSSELQKQTSPFYVQVSPIFLLSMICSISILLPLTDVFVRPLVAVQFAALAESLESSFYAQALTKFTATDFEAAGYANGETIVSRLQ